MKRTYSTDIEISNIEQVQWTFQKHGEIIRLTARAGGWEQNRMFRFEKTDTPLQKEERMLKELDNLKNDFVERVTFVFRARRGDFDDPPEGVELDWRQYLHGKKR